MDHIEQHGVPNHSKMYLFVFMFLGSISVIFFHLIVFVDFCSSEKLRMIFLDLTHFIPAVK